MPRTAFSWPLGLPLLLAVLTVCEGRDDPVGGEGDSDVDADTDVDTDTDVDVDTDTDDTGGPVDCKDLPPRVEVGTGETEFRPLLALEPVVMVHGPQGGWHMLGSVRVHNMDPIVEVHFTIHDEPSGVQISDNTYRVAVVQDRECTGYYPGMYGYLDVSALATGGITTPPGLLAGHPMLLTMAVTDYSGLTATEERRVVAQLDPIDMDMPDGDTGTP
jgi:hypothetical protein